MAALFAFTVRQILGQRKLWLTAALLLLPAAIVVLIRALAAGQTPAGWGMYTALVQMLVMVLVPLVCMFYGSGLIGAEIEQRTLVYLITRRLHRATVLVVRYAATWVALTALCELALLTLHLCVTVRSGPIVVPHTGAVWQPWPYLRCYAAVVAVAVAGYLAVFMAFSLLFARALIVSVVYFVVFELLVGNLPVGASTLSLNHHLQQSIMHGLPEVRASYNWPKDILDQLFPSGKLGADTVVAAAAVLLALSGALVTARELVPARVSRD